VFLPLELAALRRRRQIDITPILITLSPMEVNTSREIILPTTERQPSLGCQLNSPSQVGQLRRSFQTASAVFDDDKKITNTAGAGSPFCKLNAEHRFERATATGKMKSVNCKSHPKLCLLRVSTGLCAGSEVTGLQTPEERLTVF